MFKIGDVVEITVESDATGMLDFKKGEGYTVCDYRVAQAGTHTAQVYVYTDSGKGGWYAASHFKLKEDTIVEKKECLFKEGQVVWDLIYGKGEVSNVDFLNFPSRPVCVKFDQLVTYEPVLRSYTAEGISSEFGIRSLYFSEPKIEAATEPLFEPTLEGGMTLAAVDKETSRFYTLVVSEETQEVVESVHRVVFEKELFDFYRLGEKINFK